MIELLRVDDRLVHGMTAVSWCGKIKPDVILVANDESANDPFKTATLKLAKPAGAALVVASVDASIEKLKTPKYQRSKVFLITDCLEDAFKICLALPKDVHVVNFGMNNVKMRDGLITMVPQVYMTKSDWELAKKIHEMNIDFFVQAVPTYERLDFDGIKHKFE